MPQRCRVGMTDSNSQRISCIVRCWYLWEIEKSLHHRLDLVLAGLTVTRHRLLDLLRRVFRHLTPVLSAGQEHNPPRLACAQHGCEVAEYTPQQVKQAVAGYGKAGKNQVQAMVKALLNLPEIPTPDDAADALGVAICHAHSAPLRNALRKHVGD